MREYPDYPEARLRFDGELPLHTGAAVRPVVMEHRCVKPEGPPDVLCFPGIVFECPTCGGRWTAQPEGNEVSWNFIGAGWGGKQ